jgi:type VI secretion system secreted protein Hcp
MAAVDFFLKVDGIEGESQDGKHKGEIDVVSWSWGETIAGDAAERGMGAGKVSMQDFHFVMPVNKSSPRLMEACASGQHIQKAELTCRMSGREQQEYLKVTMWDLVVSSYQTGGSGGEGMLPVDQVSMNFSRIEFQYKEPKADGTLGGTVRSGWDLRANKKL